jgi:hypothetical protein
MRGGLAQIDLEAARTAMESTSANGRVIMLGSVCSPATLRKVKPEESQKCSWCSFQMATFEHLAWRCRGLPGADSRPPKPDNPLSWRFAWPTWDMPKVHHLRLLAWLASVQEQVLLDRYGSGVEHGRERCSPRQTVLRSSRVDASNSTMVTHTHTHIRDAIHRECCECSAM